MTRRVYFSYKVLCSQLEGIASPSPDRNHAIKGRHFGLGGPERESGRERGRAGEREREISRNPSWRRDTDSLVGDPGFGKALDWIESREEFSPFAVGSGGF